MCGRARGRLDRCRDAGTEGASGFNFLGRGASKEDRVAVSDPSESSMTRPMEIGSDLARASAEGAAWNFRVRRRQRRGPPSRRANGGSMRTHRRWPEPRQRDSRAGSLLTRSFRRVNVQPGERSRERGCDRRGPSAVSAVVVVVVVAVAARPEVSSPPQKGDTSDAVNDAPANVPIVAWTR